jgi:HTH-type transcriptional regulator/antitoxin HigA
MDDAVVPAPQVPAPLRDEADYAAALREVEALFLSDADTPAGRRFDQLIALIEEYDARRARADR